MSTVERTYGGRYSVIERVGSGGMAEVYRTRDELLGREVALKVLHARFSEDRAFVERFKREAQAAANLNHPNIVSLFDYGADDGAYFIVMELIDGKSLSDILRDEGALMPERAAEIAADVAKALSRAHTGGLVHRDIKPSNIMITTSGQTKVTDFGIARALGSDGDQTMTQTGMVIGTAAYFSPEQAQGNPVDARSDVYALGVVLYEMLAGRAPFTGETPLAVAYKHVREDPIAPSNVNPDVPKPLDAITMKALAKNPDNRFSSATEMQEDLERFLAGQKVHATPLLGATHAMTRAQPVGSETAVLQEQDYPPEPEPRSRAGWYVLAALGILALFGVLAYLFATNFFGGAPLRQVPNVVDRDVDEARAILERRGFEVEVDRRRSNRREGRVLAQDPPAGDEAEEGSTVTLTVSGGPGETTVPDVVDLPQSDAEELLEEAGLEVGKISPGASDEIEPGNVITSDPAPDTRVDRGSAVDLVVSTGPSAVPVPDVRGRTEEEAVDILENAGFSVNVVDAPSDTVPEGKVIAQDPEQESEAEPGATVTISVSTGPEETAMPSVIGENADDAEQFLEEEYGLVVTQDTVTDPQCTEPPGDVCDQDPAKGEPVTSGDSVTLFVQGT
jgi:beta-lactam-binding protein with PASTA domain/tRNA A-37 threonylcarbamoyl transferase component Bud32